MGKRIGAIAIVRRRLQNLGKIKSWHTSRAKGEKGISTKGLNC